MRRRARWGMGRAALVVCAGFGASFATAAMAPSPAYAADEKATREAEARFAEGLSRVKKQDYDAARLSFAQAYAVLHRPLILWNLALAEEKSGHPLDALPHFRQVAREAASPADRVSAQRHVDALQGGTARIDVQAPAGSAFTLDGADVAGAAPLAEPLDVMPGHHVVVARGAGGSKSLELDTTAGQLAHLTFAADAPPAPPAPSVAGSAPLQGAPTEAQAMAVAPPPDQVAHEESFWTPRTITAVTLGSAAVVAVGFGVVFGVESQKNKNTADNYRQAHGVSACSAPQDYCGNWNDALTAQNRDATISNALYFAGGAFALGGVISWFFWPHAHGGSATWVMPEVGPGRAGVGAGGRF